jgi:hypothetical protein
MVHLAGQYADAGEARRAALNTAFEALMAQNSAFNPAYESLFALGILFFSVVMLKGVFPRWMAYIGIANLPAAILALALWPVLGVNYFWWWVLFIVWFGGIGWRLYQLGSSPHSERNEELDQRSLQGDVGP